MHIVPAKKGEVVYIGNIRLTIERFRSNGSIDIGIEAPREIPIRREEYQESTLSLNQACETILRQMVNKKTKGKQHFWLEINVA